jgi:hypothetical protein
MEHRFKLFSHTARHVHEVNNAARGKGEARAAMTKFQILPRRRKLICWVVKENEFLMHSCVNLKL